MCAYAYAYVQIHTWQPRGSISTAVISVSLYIPWNGTRTSAESIPGEFICSDETEKAIPKKRIFAECNPIGRGKKNPPR